VGDSNIEAKDETLLTLAELSRRASDPCTLPTSNFSRTKSPVESVALRANISETGLVLLINEQKGEKEEIRDERESSQFGNHLERASGKQHSSLTPHRPLHKVSMIRLACG
jgi:hypothetical protein